MTPFIIRALQLVLSLTILVFLHEGGHFLFSKLFGVRVNKFYVFFDYKFHLFSTYSSWWRRLRGKAPIKKNDKGETEYDGTEYGIGWIPLGGYCQIEGMIDETQHDLEKLNEPAKPYEFRGKPAWQRLLIMIGGVLVNFVLALVIYSAVLFTWGDDYIAMKDMTYGLKYNDQAKEIGFRDGDIITATDGTSVVKFDTDLYRGLADAREVTVQRQGKAVTIAMPAGMDLLEMIQENPPFCRPLVPCDIDSVMPGTPAQKAGLAKGDKILAVAGTPVDSWNEFTFQMSVLADRMEQTHSAKDSLALRTQPIVVKHKTTGKIDTLTVQLTADLKIGVGQSSIASYYKPTHIEYSLLESIPAGIGYGMNVLGGYVHDLQFLFSEKGAKSLGGFGAIGGLFPPVWDWHMFWLMTAFLSIILAFMNILPIPALDGGHTLFLLVEMITGKKPSDKFMLYAQYVGMGILFALMFFANLNDILRWLGIM